MRADPVCDSRCAWAPASLALLMLAQEADRTGDDQYRVTPATLRSWVLRGRVVRGSRGYCLNSIVEYLGRRSAPMVARERTMCNAQR